MNEVKVFDLIEMITIDLFVRELVRFATLLAFFVSSVWSN